jgi:hypothetical protein
VNSTQLHLGEKNKSQIWFRRTQIASQGQSNLAVGLPIRQEANRSRVAWTSESSDATVQDNPTDFLFTVVAGEAHVFTAAPEQSGDCHRLSITR